MKKMSKADIETFELGTLYSTLLLFYLLSFSCLHSHIAHRQTSIAAEIFCVVESSSTEARDLLRRCLQSRGLGMMIHQPR